MWAAPAAPPADAARYDLGSRCSPNGGHCMLGNKRQGKAPQRRHTLFFFPVRVEKERFSLYLSHALPPESGSEERKGAADSLLIPVQGPRPKQGACSASTPPPPRPLCAARAG